jgi:hypothetical protein
MMTPQRAKTSLMIAKSPEPNIVLRESSASKHKMPNQTNASLALHMNLKSNDLNKGSFLSTSTQPFARSPQNRESVMTVVAKDMKTPSKLPPRNPKADLKAAKSPALKFKVTQGVLTRSQS